jgi:hypothetical protein
MVARGAYFLTLRVLDHPVRISCGSAAEFELLASVYGAMQRAPVEGRALEYTVRWSDERSEFLIMRAGRAPMAAADDGELIFMLEKDLTVEIQHCRRDLYFVHAAALEFEGGAMLLVAPSGAGKSTATWALLHHGFRYLSDELAPVHLPTMEVHPYPHALCLKAEPPRAYPLPSQTLRTCRTLHVPTASLPCPTRPAAAKVTAIFFLEHSPGLGCNSRLIPVSKAEAAARLFAQALNPLAHADEGLDGAAAMSCRTHCYRLLSQDLRSTADLLTRTLRTGSTRGGEESEHRSQRHAVSIPHHAM